MSQRIQSGENVVDLFHAICDFGSRLSGTKSEASALSFVANFLQSLPAGHLEQHSVTYEGWSSRQCCITIDGQDYPAFALPRSGELPDGGATLDIVDAKRGTLKELTMIGADMAGKAVIVTHEFMFAADHIHRMKKYQCAIDHGAAAFVIANPDPATGMVTGGVDGPVPGFGISHATRQALLEAKEQSVAVEFHLRSAKEPKSTRTLDWVLPCLEPRGEDQEIIICAHIDGHESSENAMDNASGVAVALASAAEFSRKKKTSCGVRVLIFSAEEFGLCGSETYVENLTEQQRKRIRAVFNLDCVGGSSVFGAMTSGFSCLEQKIRHATAETGIDVEIHTTPVKNSDHYNFFAYGIPAMRLVAGFGDPESKVRHVLTEGDTREMVSDQELNSALTLTRALAVSAL